MPHETTIADQLRAHETKLRTLQIEHEEVTSRLAEDPNDEHVNATLDAIEQEQATRKKAISRLQGAVAAERRRNTAVAKREKLEALGAARERLAHSADDLSAVACELKEAFAALALPIARWQRLVEERDAAAGFIVRNTHRDRAYDVSVALGRFSTLTDGAITEALAKMLLGSGLGQTGPDFGYFLSVTAPSPQSRSVPLEEALEYSNTRLFTQLDRFIARAAEELKTDEP